MNYQITAIVPTYRRDDYLVNTIKNLLIQSRVPDEILVLDQTPLGEHSSETESFLSEAHSKEQIRLVNLPKPGVYPARNKAIELAKHDILLYLDDDITPSRDLVRNHLRHYVNAEVQGVVGSNVTKPEQKMRPVSQEFLRQPHWMQAFTRSNIFAEPLTNICGLSGGNFSVRRHILLEVDGWDEHILNYGDRDLGIRLYEAGYRVDYDPEAKLLHHLAPVGGTRVNDPRNTLRPWERCVSLHYLAWRHLHGWMFVKYGLLRAARYSFLLRKNATRPHVWPREIIGYFQGMFIARRWAREGVKSPFAERRHEGGQCKQV